MIESMYLRSDHNLSMLVKSKSIVYEIKKTPQNKSSVKFVHGITNFFTNIFIAVIFANFDYGTGLLIGIKGHAFATIMLMWLP